jgi:hypothetical protein
MEDHERKYWTDLLTRNIAQWKKYINGDDVSEHIGQEHLEKFWQLYGRFHAEFRSEVVS